MQHVQPGYGSVAKCARDRPDVTVLRALDDALMCRIEKRVRWIPMEQLPDGSTIHQQAWGRSSYPGHYAVEWGLVPYDG
jgi:hypothetical protein